eukprot:69777-Prorocentrum_minimum.AAC.2
MHQSAKRGSPVIHSSIAVNFEIRAIHVRRQMSNVRVLPFTWRWLCLPPIAISYTVINTGPASQPTRPLVSGLGQ